MNELRFRVDGNPQTQGNKSGFAIRRKNRVTQAWEYTGRVAMVEGRRPASRQAFKVWREQIRIAAHNAKVAASWTVVDAPLELTCVFYLPKPKSPQFDVPATGLDLDKLIRAVGDGLKDAGVYVNDSRICAFPGTCKLYADESHPPGVEVWVRLTNTVLL